MDDVLGHIVFTPGDVNLGAKNLVGAICQWFGAGAHGCQIATGLGLGQIHGAGPLAADQFFQVGCFQVIRACSQQGLDRTIAQKRAQREAHVGRVLHLAAHRANGFGQALATKINRMLQALPAALGELLKSFLESGGGSNDAIFPTRWVLVTFPIQRCQHTFVELGGFCQHGLCGVKACIFKAGDFCDLIDFGQMLDVEQHVFDGRDVTHGVLRELQIKIEQQRKKRAPLWMPFSAGLRLQRCG